MFMFVFRSNMNCITLNHRFFKSTKFRSRIHNAYELLLNIYQEITTKIDSFYGFCKKRIMIFDEENNEICYLLNFHSSVDGEKHGLLFCNKIIQNDIDPDVSLKYGNKSGSCIAADTSDDVKYCP